jgi:hypothetical protein
MKKVFANSPTNNKGDEILFAQHAFHPELCYSELSRQSQDNQKLI